MTVRKLDQAALDSIAEEFATAIREGKSPTVDDFVSRYDDDSGELRSLLSSIAMIEGLKEHSPPSQSVVRLRQLDDYQIVREIGRGGMGIVYEAIHQSLGRRVALKVLSSSLLDQPKYHARFRREARAAARLRHQNIVSVFGVGQADEHHYYVMDYIRGLSLREWLQSLTGEKSRFLPTRAVSTANSECDLEFETRPLATDETAVQSIPISATNTAISSAIPMDTDSPEYFRWVAEIGMTISDALDYAHQRGVLHRDIKPANLLMDQSGSVWIADFGLAKLTEQDATMTGDIVGTPQYMSPESFEGEYDHRSETYCVGLTLYELLTLRPAINGKSNSDTIRAAIQGVTTAPRRLNQNIPRDLETIVLKSVSLEPNQRYESSGALREDLQRFLDDRPIQARRTGPIERLYRWSRREPALATLALGIFTSLVALAIVSSFAYWKTSTALIDAKVAKAGAEQSAILANDQRELAQSNLQVAIRAFDQISQRIAERGSEPDAELLGDVNESVSLGASPEDAELLNTLLTFFDELARNNSDDIELKKQSAAAQRRVGDIYSRLGKFEQADDSYLSAFESYQQISVQHPSDELTVMQSQLLNERALIAGLRGRVDVAVDLHKSTVELLQTPTLMESADAKFELARSFSLLSQLSTRSGVTNTGRRFLEHKAGPFPFGFMRGKGKTSAKANVGQLREEIAASDSAVRLLESLADDFPDDRRYGMSLARAYRDRSKAIVKVMSVVNAGKPGGGRPPREGRFALPRPIDRANRITALQAKNDLDKSIAMLRGYLEADSESPTIRYELAKSLAANTPHNTQDQREEKRKRLTEAHQLSESLLKSFPESPRYLALSSEPLELLVMMRRKQKQTELEFHNLKRLYELQKHLLTVSPGLSKYQIKLTDTALRVSELYEEKGEIDSARRVLTDASRILRMTPINPMIRGKVQKLGERQRSL